MIWKAVEQCFDHWLDVGLWVLKNIHIIRPPLITLLKSPSFRRIESMLICLRFDLTIPTLRQYLFCAIGEPRFPRHSPERKMLKSTPKSRSIRID